MKQITYNIIVDEVYLWDNNAYTSRTGYKWPNGIFLYGCLPPKTVPSENLGKLTIGTPLIVNKFLYGNYAAKDKSRYLAALVETSLSNGEKREGFIYIVYDNKEQALLERHLYDKEETLWEWMEKKDKEIKGSIQKVGSEIGKVIDKQVRKTYNYIKNTIDSITSSSDKEKSKKHVSLTVNTDQADRLKDIQSLVMNLPCIQAGAKGIYGVGTSTDTYCNHAVFLTIKATDNNYTSFTGGVDFPPWQTGSANYWCDVLEEAADSGKIDKITPEEAQELANHGFTVIGSWKNPSGHPHYVTVSPKQNTEFDSTVGPWVAHVGAGTSTCMSAKSAFAGHNNDVLWYYNENQQFTYKTDVIQQYDN